jgi:uncharacterized membrane protein
MPRPATVDPTAPVAPRPIAAKVTGLFVVWLVLGLGIGLRFANLAGKPVWIDEAFSLFHVSGFSDAVARRQFLATPPVTVADLLQYQGPHPQNTLWGTIDNIANTAPELPPLYFILLNLWMTVFGQSVMAIRSLSAVLGLFCFPALYWLCWELFGLPIVGWYAMALLAVSPFNFIMAQEARPYTLWTACFLVASAALRRAQRTQTQGDWRIYTIAMMMAFYTHLFSLLIWLVYMVYVGWSERWRWTLTVRKYLRSSVVTVLAFVPWIWLGFIDPGDPNHKAFVRPYSAPIELIKGLTRGIALFFVDFNLNEKSPKIQFFLYMGLIGLVLGLVGLSLRYLLRRSPPSARQFIGMMAFLPIGLFLVTDLLMGASRTTITRYFIPSGMAIQIAIAFMIASKQTLRFQASELWPRWQKRFAALLLAGLLSCGWFILSPTWWSKDRAQGTLCIAQITDRLVNPLLVTDAFYVRAMGLGHNLKPTVRFQFLPDQAVYAPKLPIATDPVYLYLPSPPFHKAMADRYQLQSVCPNNALWQVAAVKSAATLKPVTAKPLKSLRPRPHSGDH